MNISHGRYVAQSIEFSIRMVQLRTKPIQVNGTKKKNIDLRISFYFLFLLVAHTHTHGGNFSTKNTIIFRNALFGKQNKHAIGVAIGSALNTEKFTSEQFVALLIYS